MTRVAIISDTHMPRGARRLPDACVERIQAADLLLHAGDVADLATLDMLRRLGPPLHAVAGNVDDAAVRATLPAEAVLAVDGVRIGMVHDSGAATGRLARLRARFPDAAAVVFGHSHLPLHEQGDGLQIFNPGSPTERRRAPHHTMGVAVVEGGRIAFELIAVD
jgi:putative phosphoesterase